MIRTAVVVCLALLGVSSAIFINEDKPSWDALKVTWKLVGSPSSMPRTETEATNAGWSKVTNLCDDNGSKFRGFRYMKLNDHGTILLFGKNGYIAGMQTSIPSNKANFPDSSLIPNPYVKGSRADKLVLTAYFVDPSTICSTGRDAAAFKRDGTGTDLYIQTGDNPEKDFMKVPRKQADVDKKPEWVKGKCFWSMGMHYWYNLDVNMQCSKFYPYFLLYNKNVLTGFGFALMTSLQSKRFEHPDQSKFSLFMKEVPTCTKNIPEVSTMHVFLTDDWKLGLRC